MRLHHVALGARDVERLARFYAEVFGLPELARHHDGGELRSVWLDLDGTILMIERSRDEARRVQGIGAGPFLLAFGVRDGEREQWESRLAVAGAPIESRTAHTAYARDPEGNRIAISDYPHPGRVNCRSPSTG